MMQPDEPQFDQLSEKYQATSILRMLLDERRSLVHGELVDVAGKSWGHFSSWDSLLSALEEWLSMLQNQAS